MREIPVMTFEQWIDLLNRIADEHCIERKSPNKEFILGFKIGKECILEGKPGRVLKPADGAMSAVIDGVVIPSMVLFQSLGNPVIKTGITFLSPITEEGKIKLKELEDYAKQTGIWYEENIKEINSAEAFLVDLLSKAIK
jgi:hypothetical protein